MAGRSHGKKVVICRSNGEPHPCGDRRGPVNGMAGGHLAYEAPADTGTAHEMGRDGMCLPDVHFNLLSRLSSAASPLTVVNLIRAKRSSTQNVSFPF